VALERPGVSQDTPRYTAIVKKYTSIVKSALLCDILHVFRTIPIQLLALHHIVHYGAKFLKEIFVKGEFGCNPHV